MPVKPSLLGVFETSYEFECTVCVNCARRSRGCSYEPVGDTCLNFEDLRDDVDGPSEYSAAIDTELEQQADTVDVDMRCEICFGNLVFLRRRNMSPFKGFPICSSCFPQLSSEQLDRMKLVQDSGLSLSMLNEQFPAFWASGKTFLQLAKTYPEIVAVPSENDIPGEVAEVELDAWDVQQAKKYISRIQADMQEIKNKFWFIAYNLYECNMLGYFRALDYESIYEFAAKEFDFKRSTTKNLIGLIKAYSIKQLGGPSACIQKRYEPYSQTQLVEMLPLSDIERELIEPSMTVAEIRAMKAALKKGTVPGGSGCKGGKKDDQEEDVVIDHASEPCGNLPEPKVEVSPVDSPVDPGMVTWIPFGNDKDRKDWLDRYQEWNVWYDIPDLNLTVYRWVFDNGDMITVHTTKSVFAAAGSVCDAHYFNVLIKDPVVLKSFREAFGPYVADACVSFDIKGGGGRAFALDYLRHRKLKGVNMLCRKH